ncbi:MAG: aryl-sulfate sulfotransferase [Bryobacterales bacterium]|nr:aryl-sulfate sulfotransferase [Bryobacterales bacterium]
MKQLILTLLAPCVGVLPAFATITVTLTPDLNSPQPVGTSITWTAVVTDTSAGDHDYRFTAQKTGAPVQVLSDYAMSNTWVWTQSAFEGAFTVGVVARNRTTGETGSAAVPYQLSTRLVNGLAAVTSTANPLVARFSAPACLSPNSMQIVFFRGGMYEATVQTTNLEPCRAIMGAPRPDLSSMNFYIAGMYPSTEYLMRFEVLAPDGTLLAPEQALAPTGAPVNMGRNIAFTTGPIPAGTPLSSFVVTLPPPAGGSDQKWLLHSWNNRNSPSLQFATDLVGSPVWFYQGTADADRIYRPGWGGKLMALHNNATSPLDSTLREIDLAGNTLVETSVRRVNEQLAQMGLEPISNFSHDVSRIFNPGKPNHGHIVLLATTHLISTTHQGGTPRNPVDIVGDDVIVLDRNLQVAWAWSPYPHLDLDRAAVLGETCTPTGQCKPAPGFTSGNDWTHANSARYTPWDGNIIVSLRHQDWVVKVNYADGTGDGSVVWRLGKDGDFTITTKTTESTPDIGYRWFSHQHDAEFEFRGTVIGSRRVMTVFDNGNTRVAQFNPSGHSRCQIYAVDEANRTVNLNTSADEGVYGSSQGSAQALTNGNVACTNGSNGRHAESDQQGNLVYVLDPPAPGAVYRSFRMKDFYTTPTY